MDSVEDGMWWYRALHALVLPEIGPAGLSKRLLDAGCGTGGFLARLGVAGAVGVEFHPAAAARAAAKSGALVVAGTVGALPFADGTFATVVSLDVLSHAAVQPAQALTEFWRVLQPGGSLVLNLPAFEWLRSAHDARVQNARRFTAAEVRALLAAAGFEAVRARYWNALLLPLMALHRKLAARAPAGRSDVAAFSPWLDRTLFAITRLERALLRAGLHFPAGGSLLAVATRPAAIHAAPQAA